jgi:hypothetical protein
MSDKMLLRLRITVPEPRHIRAIELSRRQLPRIPGLYCGAT